MSFLFDLGVIFILYCTSLHGDWLFDDYTGILADSNVRNRTIFFDWKQPRYLLWLSYVLNAKYLDRLYAHNPIPSGQFPEPVGFHLVNMGIHAVNAWLVSWIAASTGLSSTVSTTAGLIFAVHPLAVNAVASISGRSSSLAATFYFLSIGAALHGWMIGAIGAMLCAFWVKEDTITLLPLLALIAFLIRPTPEAWLLLPVTCAVVIVGWHHYRRVSHKTGRLELNDCGYPPSAVSDRDYPRTVFTETILRFPQWICGRNLQIDADVKPSSRLASWDAGTVVAIVVWLAWMIPSMRFGVLFILCSPAFAYPFFRLPDPIAEHRAYVSLLGVSILLAQVLSIPSLIILPLILSIVYFATLTIKRQHAWTTGVRLFVQNWKDGARHPRVFINLNWAYQQSGEYAKSEEWAREAIQRAPHMISIYLNRAEAERQQGRLKNAIGILKTAMAVTPRARAGWKQLGAYCELDQDWTEALLCYIRTMPLELEAEMFNQAGSLFWRLGDPDTAQFFFASAFAMNSQNPSFRYNLAMIAFVKGKTDEAKHWLAGIPEGASVPAQLKELLAC